VEVDAEELVGDDVTLSVMSETKVAVKSNVKGHCSSKFTSK